MLTMNEREMKKLFAPFGSLFEIYFDDGKNDLRKSELQLSDKFQIIYFF